MPTESGSHVVHVHESDAGLAYDERIGWWRNYTIRNIGLKVDNAGAGEIEIVSPPRNNRIRLNPFMTMFLEEGEERFPHLPKTVTSTCGRVPYESLFRAALWSRLSTNFLIWILSPEINATRWTQFPYVSDFIEEWHVILAFWKTLQLSFSSNVWD